MPGTRRAGPVGWGGKGGVRLWWIVSEIAYTYNMLEGEGGGRVSGAPPPPGRRTAALAHLSSERLTPNTDNGNKRLRKSRYYEIY